MGRSQSWLAGEVTHDPPPWCIIHPPVAEEVVMFAFRSRDRRRRRCVRAVLAAAAAGVLASTPASAHFVLQYPPSWRPQDGQGSPQKMGPCGDENPLGAKPTGHVEMLQSGQTITLKWQEMVGHDGWYRISLSANRGDFTNPPLAIQNGIAVDAGIESPPMQPVLVDGLYKHTAAAGTGKAYTYDLTLPAITCAKCTLQVIQVMLQHGDNLPNANPDGYFYHHCADISLQAGDGGSISDASGGIDVTVAMDSGSGSTASSGSGASDTGASSGLGVSGGSTISSGASGSASSGVTGINSGSGASSGLTTSISGTASATMTGPASSNSSGCSISARKVPLSLGPASLGLAMGISLRRRRRSVAG